MEHSRAMRQWRVSILVAIAACGGASGSDCPIDEPGDHGPICLSAQVLAARYSSELTPSQDEIDHTLEIYCRAFEPIRGTGTLGHPPTATAWTSVQQVTARATNPQLTEPWQDGRVQTGLTVVDEVLARASIERVVAQGGELFALQSDRILAAQNIDTALESVPGLLIDEQFVPPLESFTEVLIDYPEGPNGPVDVRFSIGWGDCTVDCDGQHHWQVRVDSETATLTSEGGDAIPAEVLRVWADPAPGC